MKKAFKFMIIILLTHQINQATAQLTTSGSETVVNTTIANNQQRPAVAIDASGNYLVAWESIHQDGDGYGIYAQAYNNAGAAQTSEFLINSTTSNDQRFPDVAMDSDGDVVVAWQSYDQDGGSWGIYFQRYDNAYTAQGSETLVNTTTSGRQSMPKIAMDNNGNFAITWESEGDIKAKLYNSDGTTAVGEFTVNTTTNDIQNYSDIAMDSDGDIVVVWQSYNQDGNGFGIYHQRYNASGVAQGSETIVNTTTANQQTSPSVSIDQTGNYIIIWTDDAADGDGNGIYGQLFNADGTTKNSQFKVNTTSSNAQDNGQVAMAQNGPFVVVWNSYAQDGQYTGVYNQSYNSDGSTSGSEMLINTTTNYFQQFPAVAFGDNSETIIVWQDGNPNESNSLDTDGYGVVFQKYNASALPVELLYFYAEQVNEGVQLDWQTVTEINNSHFEVEWSTNGIDFAPNSSSESWKKIGEVAGAGTTTEVQFYDFLHKKPVYGENYYRLKQVDLTEQANLDSKYEYSDILNITITPPSHQVINIYPNPATDFITIENGTIGETIQVINANGQLIRTFQLSITHAQYPVSDLSKGIYFIKIGTAVKRIIIQ